jgi:hypothetical protein
MDRWMVGVIFEGDISVSYNNVKKSRRMLPFAFQVTDAHTHKTTIVVVVVIIILPTEEVILKNRK